MHGRNGRKDRVTIFLIMQPKYKRTLMIYMWFTGINYYKLAVEKDRDSIFTTMTTAYGNQASRLPLCNQSIDTLFYETF